VSAGAPTVTIPARFGRPEHREAVAAANRHWVRQLTFAALTLYGLGRWATLLRPAPGWRLLGLLALSVALAAAVPLLRQRSRVVAGAVAGVVMLAAFPVSGLSWGWVRHVRIAASADRIATGLQALPNALVPYTGHSQDVRLVIVLGAAVLALDAAAVIAFSPLSFGDARRAAAAVPLIALAIVPSTLVRPELPYLQGLLLFALLAAFVWGERVRREGLVSALAVAALAGLGGAIAAPRLDSRSPWLDYRAWAGSLVLQHLDTFDWNQSYGPLHWPRFGHEVLTVRARTGDYWKAEDLDTFNGHDWVQGIPAVTSAPPSPSRSALARWTQDLTVTIEGMQTSDVIAAGYAGPPSGLPDAFAGGAQPGTWTGTRPLGPGTTYEISTYSPRPSAAQLIAAGRQPYPAAELAGDLSLTIPKPGLPPSGFPTITFPPFGSAEPPSPLGGAPNPAAETVVAQSPYGAVYALARRLAERSSSPYAFVSAVLRMLSHYTYNEDPPVRAYPLASFLFTDRQGYCQQFSGAMAMLLRMGGIPARVAAGFTSGTYDARRHQWVVTDIDAHAWVEAWFPPYGWVRFDPTPVSAPARTSQGAPPILKSFGALSNQSPKAPRRAIAGADAVTPAARGRSGGGTGPWAIALAVGLLAGLGLGLGTLLVRRDGPEDLLAELERALSRTGRPLADGTTLVALERRFHSSPEAAGYIRTLRLARYGGRRAVPSASARRALRQELRRGLGLSGPVRALWALPPRLRRPGRRRNGLINGLIES
jgi:transglutaminase-like putative cysteine protease